ncbi:MAG: penicillin-binding protein activator [Candidatus Paceibacterota bacterium]
MKKITLLLAGLIFLLIGCQNQSSTTNEVTIGAVLPLTGENASYGIKARNGYELAKDVILDDTSNTTGLRILYEDSRAESRLALSAFNKLTLNQNILVTVGFLRSSEVLSVAPVANTRKIILFSTGASSPDITNAGDYIFRNVPSDIYEPTEMASYMYNEITVSEVSVLYINNDYGIGVANEFKESFTTLGGEIVREVSYGDDTLDFRTQIQTIKESNSQGVYIIGYNEMGRIVKQMKELGLETKLFSTALFEDNQILEEAGSAAENIVFTSITFDSNSDDPYKQIFEERYTNKYGEQPDGFAAVAYDAIMLLYDSMKNNPRDVEKIKSNLYDVETYKGLLGDFHFDKNGDVVLPISLKKVENSKFITLKN